MNTEERLNLARELVSKHPLCTSRELADMLGFPGALNWLSLHRGDGLLGRWGVWGRPQNGRVRWTLEPIALTATEETPVREQFGVGGICGCDGALDNGCPLCDLEQRDKWALARRARVSSCPT